MRVFKEFSALMDGEKKTNGAKEPQTIAMLMLVDRIDDLLAHLKGVPKRYVRMGSGTRPSKGR